MVNMDFGNDSMLEMYLFESTTLLEQLDDILLQSEKDDCLSAENVNEIFRIMHTIKGSSAMMEFETISLVSHKLEDLFFIIREHGINTEFSQELFDLVLKVSDFLKEEVEKIQQNSELSVGNDSLIAEITALIVKLKDQSSRDTYISNGQKNYFLHIKFAPDCQMENIRAFILINKLESIGKVIASIPSDLETNNLASDIISRDGFYCSFCSNFSAIEIESVVIGTLSVSELRFLDSLPENSENAANMPTILSNSDNTSESNPKIKQTKQNLISVDLNKLDTLMDLVGEIVITESMVSGSPDLSGLELENFHKSSRQLRKLTDELQDIVMSIRMVPISSTFQKMKRIVRDMGKKLSKDVDLVLIGEATEVDKTIIDSIADPLMHLVRNAMDHAIEDKAGRIAAKKNPVGQIILSAQNIGGDIIISVSDDGKGLDTDMILEKAKSKNLLTKPDSEYSEKEIFQFLTAPGFSTKESVTEFSGRGVGMDIVKKNIEKIGGTITIESVKGSGTNIFFKIPLTLAIIESMEIKVGDNIYAIPISNIRESFKACHSQLLSDPDRNEMIMIRGDCYPIIRLNKIFHIDNSKTKIEDGILLLVDSGDQLACIFADELIGKHQVVVKPLPIYLNWYAKNASGIAGCTILGDGSISLIIDIQGILNQY